MIPWAGFDVACLESGRSAATYRCITYGFAQTEGTIPILVGTIIPVVVVLLRPVAETIRFADIRGAIIQSAAHGIDRVEANAWQESLVRNGSVGGIAVPCRGKGVREEKQRSDGG